MTQVLVGDRSDFLASTKPESALRPPELTIANLAKDLARHIGVYRDNRLNMRTAVAFLVLRVLQHMAYDRGWNRGLQSLQSSFAVGDGAAQGELGSQRSGQRATVRRV